jgi:peptide/nickel transport system substrate-binding protein
MTLSRRDLLLSTLAAGALVQAGGAPARAQGAPKRGGSLVASWGGFEPQALFVPAGGGSSPYFTSTKVLERLLKLDNDLKFQPVLALSVTPAPDYRSYTIALRPDVKWHDGRPFTADDVVFNALQYWKPISSGGALDALTDAEALDPLTVKLSFKNTTPEFFLKSVLAGKAGLVIPKHVYEGSNIITNPANNTLVGTGPYRLKEWVRGSHVEYTRNDSYWDPKLPYLDRLVIRWWRDPASRSAALEAGQLDIGLFNPVPAPDFKRLSATGRFKTTNAGYLNGAWTTSIEFNSRRPVVSRVDVRQALMHAIDREFIADTVYFGLAKPGIGPIPASNTVFGTDKLPRYEFDPKKAAKLLDAAGFPVKGASRFKVNLVAAGWFEENGKIGQYLKQALGDVDVDVDLAVPDRPTSLKRIYTDYDYDIAISNNSGPIELIPAWTNYFTTDAIVKGAAFRNANGYSNPKLDAVVGTLATEVDEAKRVELAHEFLKTVARDLPLTALVDIDSTTIARADVRNHSNLADYLGESWSDIWLDR